MATAKEFIDWARGEIGYTETPAGSNRNKYAQCAGHANGVPWCATFLVCGARTLGIVLPSESPYTPSMAAGFMRERRWYRDPEPGDFAFWDFLDAKRRIQHVSLVVSFNRITRRLTTIDANSAGPGGSQDNGGAVVERTRSIRDVVGYGRPAYNADVVVPPTIGADQVDLLFFVQAPEGVYLVTLGSHKMGMADKTQVANMRAAVAARGGDAQIYTWSQADLDRHPTIV